MPRHNSTPRKHTRTRGGAPQHSTRRQRPVPKDGYYNKLAADLVRRGLASPLILGPIAPRREQP